jgi:hypothetical protein
VIICRLNNTPHASLELHKEGWPMHMASPILSWYTEMGQYCNVHTSRSKYHQVSIWELLPRAVLQTGSADWTLPIRRIDSIFTVFYSHWDVLQVHNL